VAKMRVEQATSIIAHLIKIDQTQTDRSKRCRFMMLHLWCHIGQLSFIQTLVGDDDRHRGMCLKPFCHLEKGESGSVSATIG